MKTTGTLLLLCTALTACATFGGRKVTPLSWEFGRDLYLTDEYLASTPGAVCERYFVQLRIFAPLPDGTYYTIHAIPSAEHPEPWITLERGTALNRPVQALSLDPQQGIVRGFDRGEAKAYGIRTSEAAWLAELGRRALDLQCAER